LSESYRSRVESMVYFFLCVVEAVEVLFLVEGASGWTVLAAVATVMGGAGTGNL
jgi:uncharacterized membrane protein